jgi:hypothetical protein
MLQASLFGPTELRTPRVLESRWLSEQRFRHCQNCCETGTGGKGHRQRPIFKWNGRRYAITGIRYPAFWSSTRDSCTAYRLVPLAEFHGDVHADLNWAVHLPWDGPEHETRLLRGMYHGILQNIGGVDYVMCGPALCFTRSHIERWQDPNWVEDRF